MISFKTPGAANVLVPYTLPVVTDFVPFRMERRFELFDAGGKLNVGDNAGAEAGTDCT